MAPHQQELSNGLNSSSVDGLRGEPLAAAKVRIAVLGFSDDVRVRLAMSPRVDGETSLPEIAVRGATNYAAVFDDLLHRIPADVQWLRAEGYKVHRPVVFFLSDGQPTDGGSWRGPHAGLTDKARTPAAPNIIACGIGEARADTMAEVATRPEFSCVARAGTDIGLAISEFFHSLIASLVASGHALNSANPQLVVNRLDSFTTALAEVALIGHVRNGGNGVRRAYLY